MALSQKEAKASSSPLGGTDRVWLGAETKDAESDGSGKLDYRLIVKQSSGNAHALVRESSASKSWTSLLQNAPSLDQLLVGYTAKLPPSTTCNGIAAAAAAATAARQAGKGVGQGVETEAGAMDEGGTAVVDSISEASEKASGRTQRGGTADIDGSLSSPGGMPVSSRRASNASEEFKAAGVGVIPEGLGFVTSLIGLVDPSKSTSTRLATIRKQFKHPVKGTQFAAKGYETKWGSATMSKRMSMVSAPKIDLMELNVKEKGVSGVADWQEQIRFGLSEREKDLVSDMRRVLSAKNHSYQTLTQKVMQIVMKHENLYRQGSVYGGFDDAEGGGRVGPRRNQHRGSCIARFDGLGSDAPWVIEDNIRCALPDHAPMIQDVLVYPPSEAGAGDATAFVVFETAESCMSGITKGLLLGLKASEGTHEDVARHHVSRKHASYATLPHPPSSAASSRPPSSAFHTGLGIPPRTPRTPRTGSILRLSTPGGGLQQRIRVESKGPPLEIAKDSLRPFTAPVTAGLVQPSGYTQQLPT